MNDKEIKEAQKSEFEVLKAIFYNDDLLDLRKKPSNIWQPLKVSLRLTQQGGSSNDSDARVDLLVSCSGQYPLEAPGLELQNVKGISQDQANHLLKELEEKAQSHIGTVMIYELAVHVQEYLYEHGKPESKSFYEEMMLQSKKKQHEQQEQLNYEQEALAKEVKERQELHKQAIKRDRDERRLSEQSSSSSYVRTSCNESSNDLSVGFMDVSCHHPPKIITFSNITVTRGQCIEHSSEKSTLFTSMDTSNGQMYLLSEWIIEEPTTNGYSNDQQVSVHQFHNIEQELKSLLRLRHPNLVHYVNMERSILSEGTFAVNLLIEFVLGSNCDALYISRNNPVDIEMLRMISESVLSALDFLHRNNIVHKNMSASCVYICNRQIKLANFSIYQRLTDLVSQSTNSNNYSKKVDIFEFGILILSLIKGSNVDEGDLTIPCDVRYDLKDFLEKCISKDEIRHTTTQLLNHSFLTVPTEKKSPIRKQLLVDENSTSEAYTDDIKFLAQPNLDGKSRVDSEFEHIAYLGEGAFGQVYKVRNRLDQRVYALKRIHLNSKNKLANRKIIREVKLLSGLNHENVVRYYNSWIESATVPANTNDDDDEEDDNEVDAPSSFVHRRKFTPIDEFMEKLVPNAKALAWSISYGGKSCKNQESSESGDSSSSEDEENDVWSDSDSVQFEDEADCTKSRKSTADDDHLNIDEKSSPKQIQIMYITMEFCEKSTLRSAIDENLYTDRVRLWRLFREIVEGMSHIHQQGMIHRDLKPVNIFLDVNDHVKIGDFGLATSNLLTKNEPIFVGSQSDKIGPSGDLGSLTGQIGTALYVAPELNSNIKAHYNEKVDIYSLGIIFFEMSYKYCSTQTERIQVLSKLRTDKIIFPDDFDIHATPAQKSIINWLMDHDPRKRPSSQELLESDRMPPPVLEEKELRDMLKHTLKNPQFKAYKYLVESCLNQPVSMVQDISYDKDMGPLFTTKNQQIFNHVKKLVVKVFELHGAQEFSTPTMMPKNKCYDGVESCVRLMTHSGSVVTIPYDLRVPFARYVAWNGITNLRRYSIAKVYREKRAFGFIPRELYECAFDIVTPTSGNLMADAEVIYLMDELAASVPGLRERNLLIRLNHMSLLKAILLNCGIKDRHLEFYSILADAKEGKMSKIQRRLHLINYGMTNHHINTLIGLLDTEASIGQIQNTLQSIIKRRNTEPANLARQALQDLQTIIDNATNLGVNSNIVINLGIIYKVPQYSGVICQLVYPSYKKHKPTVEVLMAGGRYDETIIAYKSMIQSYKDVQQSAVGVSISLDPLVAIFSHHQRNEHAGPSAESNVSHIDVVVGCIDKTKSALKRVAMILRDLRAADIKVTSVAGTNQKEITDQADELNVPYVIIFNNGHARIQHFKNPEKWDQYNLNTLKENLQRVNKIYRNAVDMNTENSAPNLSRSESIHRASMYSQYPEVGVKCVEILYVMHGDKVREKIPPHVRKRHEQHIWSKITEPLKKLNGDVKLLAVNIDRAMLSSIASTLNFSSEDDLQKSENILKDKYTRYMKFLEDLGKKVYMYKTNNYSIILFSLEDSYYHVFL